MECLAERKGIMKKNTKLLMITLFCLGYLSGFAQTFKLMQVHTDDVCLMQLMENITKVIQYSQWPRDARCHYLSTTKRGADTILEIHSYDSGGIYHTLLEQELFGVCLLFDHEFYIGTSLAKLFYATNHTFKKRYDREIEEKNVLSFNDCYYHWLFKKNFCGIDLYESWTMEDFKDWYNLELDSNCFCNYKKMSIELIEEEPEDIDTLRQ